MAAPTLKLCLVDMNNGVKNEATRCFKRLFESFTLAVREANPGLDVRLRHVQPRNLGELPGQDADLILSSGGPGSPFDGYEDPWCTGYRHFLDSVVERNLQAPGQAPGVFVVCHSFEIAVNHFQVATMSKREALKFGVFPSYPTEVGQRTLFEAFGDRLFTWEHRSWEALDLDVRRLSELGGKLLATESREGGVDKGQAVTALHFAPGIVGTQFHPEADRPGVIAWINRSEHAAALRDAYGNSLYERMMKTLADPTRLGKTFALLIPGWLTRRFNRLADERGLRPIAPPVEDMRQFEVDVEPERRQSV
jgi:GMP synthase-like glutamine amidotransferase